MPEGAVMVCREVLVMVMRKHQRYFPLYKPASQDLLPFFITVANGPIDVPTVKVSLPSALPFNLLLMCPPPKVSLPFYFAFRPLCAYCQGQSPIRFAFHYRAACPFSPALFP